MTGASGHQGAIYAVALSPDAKTIASGGADKYIRLWTIVKNRLTEIWNYERYSAPSKVALALERMGRSFR